MKGARTLTRQLQARLTEGLMRKRNCSNTESPWTACSGLQELVGRTEEEETLQMAQEGTERECTEQHTQNSNMLNVRTWHNFNKVTVTVLQLKSAYTRLTSIANCPKKNPNDFGAQCMYVVNHGAPSFTTSVNFE